MGASRKKRRTGFTLVELLVAAAVIAVGMVYVLGALGRCMMALTASERMVAATYLLNGKLWELNQLYRKAGVREGTKRGVFARPYERFEWHSVVGDVKAVLPYCGNKTQILRSKYLEETVTVWWRQGGGTRNVSVTRYLSRCP